MNAADPGRSRRERSTGNRRKEARLGTGCNRREKTCCTNSSTTRSASTSLSMKVHQTVWHILFYRSLRGVLPESGGSSFSVASCRPPTGLLGPWSRWSPRVSWTVAAVGRVVVAGVAVVVVVVQQDPRPMERALPSPAPPTSPGRKFRARAIVSS